MFAAALAGAADAQRGPSRGYRGGYERFEARGWRGPPREGPPDRPPPERFMPDRPPPRGVNSLGADWRDQQDEARQGVRRGRMAPLGRVIEGIGRRAPGRQLDTGIEYHGDRPVYRVRWITAHGRRVDYIVDAATGAILGER
ncbi:MAG: PepSY domain-containing protein [Caulobacteraceae bacterium]